PLSTLFPYTTLFRSLLATVAEGFLLVPLTLRDDVADLIVGQTDQNAVRTAQLLVDRRLDRRRREVGAGIGWVLHLVEHQFRINRSEERRVGKEVRYG